MRTYRQVKSPHSDLLLLKIYDYDVGSNNDLLGAVEVSISSLLSKYRFWCVLPLQLNNKFNLIRCAWLGHRQLVWNNAQRTGTKERKGRDPLGTHFDPRYVRFSYVHRVSLVITPLSTLHAHAIYWFNAKGPGIAVPQPTYAAPMGAPRPAGPRPGKFKVEGNDYDGNGRAWPVLKLKFKIKDNYHLKGKIHYDSPPQKQKVHGSVSGDIITWTNNWDSGSNVHGYHYTGTLSGDSLTGTYRRDDGVTHGTFKYKLIDVHTFSGSDVSD